ncbi:MAG: prolyl oligopeptidase family serine peptidase, partial [Actinomycetota bacterium]|nr:prolyl oligopeptidase family serine peptidase [Actinomycetota bacterium]
TLDRRTDVDRPALTYPGTGSTEAGLLRPSPPSALGKLDVTDPGLTAYLVSDAGLACPELLAVPIGPGGRRGEAGRLAAHGRGELEILDADDAGRLLVLVWNVAGRSVIELLDTASGDRRVLDHLPSAVVSGCVMARDGRFLVVCVEDPGGPRRLWWVDTTGLSFRPLSESSPRQDLDVVVPSLECFEAYDGLALTGWLYRPPDETGAGAVVISLHGGPEAQERPVFNPQHQALVAAGISVFAPNVRGSSGFGRAFAHADDRYGRYDAIADVEACVRHLINTGVADPSRVAVAGRSYGGYLTLAALVRYPELFAAGVDVCGMSDLTTFFRDTEPWIAAASASKYGDPGHDQALLRDLSPLRHVARITAPLLVVHGEHDTNVPLPEASQVVAAMRAAGRSVEYLELEGEGHEYRRTSSRLLLVETMTRFLVDHLGARRVAPIVEGPHRSTVPSLPT